MRYLNDYRKSLFDSSTFSDDKEYLYNGSGSIIPKNINKKLYISFDNQQVTSNWNSAHYTCELSLSNNGVLGVFGLYWNKGSWILREKGKNISGTEAPMSYDAWHNILYEIDLEKSIHRYFIDGALAGTSSNSAIVGEVTQITLRAISTNNVHRFKNIIISDEPIKYGTVVKQLTPVVTGDWIDNGDGSYSAEAANQVMNIACDEVIEGYAVKGVALESVTAIGEGITKIETDFAGVKQTDNLGGFMTAYRQTNLPVNISITSKE